MKISRFSLLSFIILSFTITAEAQYLKRSTTSENEFKMELSAPSAHYFPLFGKGDDSSSVIKGLIRYGNLILDSPGKSETAEFQGEEQVVYVLEGTGMITCNKVTVPVSMNDFIYIPAGSRLSFSNPRERKLSLFLMGFRMVPGDTIKPSAGMMIANADEVKFQVLGYHGPTTTFQLLMGTTLSTRDRLASACRVSSLFVMDFAAGGTNIPHRHDDEEEIYYILRGKGEIVAGETTDGKELRHPSKAGDAYFFSPKTLIGFYSGNTECEEHARILAVRFRYPAKQ
jgi:mannose-6-phosphate isomerase-like protein (cupin superfamily)